MQRGTGGKAGASRIAGVPVNFRVHEHHMCSHIVDQEVRSHRDIKNTTLHSSLKTTSSQVRKTDTKLIV